MGTSTDSPMATCGDFPESLGREYEARLLRLVTGRPRDVEAWRAAGPEFFMAGLAVMLASVRGEDRAGLLALAESVEPPLAGQTFGPPSGFNAMLAEAGKGH